MIADNTFNNITSWYRSYPYKPAIYILWDENEEGYIYTKIDKNDNNSINKEWGLNGSVLPLFYEEDFAFYFASKQPHLRVKMISHSALKLLGLWCETEKITPIFLTTIDRRNCGEKEIDKNKSKFKKEFIHFLFDKTNF